MRVSRVLLRDFRNYERAELHLAAGLTVVWGENGAGKTNLLEGLYFGLTGRSCRTANEREVVRQGASATRASVETVADDGAHLVEVGFVPGEPKRLRVDGAVAEHLGVSAARPPVSVFLPDRLELVKGAPALRRGHLDQFVGALWPARTVTRAAYGRALAQRNALIGRLRSGRGQPSLLDAWDAELARHGAQLMRDRASAAALLEEPFARHAAELGLPGLATLSYQPRSRATDAEALREELRARREDDLARGFSAHGPHRDELELSHNGRSLRAFGSQGQQRVGLLGLLFGERDALVERAAPPLMLLDDVMSELDGERRERLSELLRGNGQAVVTATEPDHVPGAGDPDVMLVPVSGGSLSPRRAVAA